MPLLLLKKELDAVHFRPLSSNFVCNGFFFLAHNVIHQHLRRPFLTVEKKFVLRALSYTQPPYSPRSSSLLSNRHRLIVKPSQNYQKIIFSFALIPAF